MSTDDPLQRNIRRTTGLHALKQIRAIVDKEDADDAFKARALHWLVCYGWLLLLLFAALLARFWGVI